MFEDCEMVDTIIVETNRLKTINKHLRKNSKQGQNRDTDLVVAVEILFKARVKEGKRY